MGTVITINESVKGNLSGTCPTLCTVVLEHAEVWSMATVAYAVWLGYAWPGRRRREAWLRELWAYEAAVLATVGDS